MEMERQSLVLLKNANNTLPLDKIKLKKIFVSIGLSHLTLSDWFIQNIYLNKSIDLSKNATELHRPQT